MLQASEEHISTRFQSLVEAQSQFEKSLNAISLGAYEQGTGITSQAILSSTDVLGSDSNLNLDPRSLIHQN